MGIVRVKYKITDKHYNLFKKECAYWMQRLGLISWSVFYDRKDLKGDFAQCKLSYSNRVATLSISTNFDVDETINLEEQVKRSALHECLELLLEPLYSSAADRTWNKVDYEKENHIVIMTLENVLISK